MTAYLEEDELVVGKYYWVGFYVGPPAVLKYEGLQFPYPSELKHDR